MPRKPCLPNPGMPLALVRADYPRLHLVVHEDMTRHLADKLDEQLLDVAFLALPASFGQGARVELALFAEPFLVACPAGHEISPKFPRIKRASFSPT